MGRNLYLVTQKALSTDISNRTIKESGALEFAKKISIITKNMSEGIMILRYLNNFIYINLIL